MYAVGCDAKTDLSFCVNAGVISYYRKREDRSFLRGENLECLNIGCLCLKFMHINRLDERDLFVLTICILECDLL